jgi:hypothetical protein
MIAPTPFPWRGGLLFAKASVWSHGPCGAIGKSELAGQNSLSKSNRAPSLSNRTASAITELCRSFEPKSDVPAVAGWAAAEGDCFTNFGAIRRWKYDRCSTSRLRPIADYFFKYLNIDIILGRNDQKYRRYMTSRDIRFFDKAKKEEWIMVKKPIELLFIRDVEHIFLEHYEDSTALTGFVCGKAGFNA